MVFNNGYAVIIMDNSGMDMRDNTALLQMTVQQQSPAISSHHPLELQVSCSTNYQNNLIDDMQSAALASTNTANHSLYNFSSAFEVYI